MRTEEDMCIAFVKHVNMVALQKIIMARHTPLPASPSSTPRSAQNALADGTALVQALIAVSFASGEKAYFAKTDAAAAQNPAAHGIDEREAPRQQRSGRWITVLLHMIGERNVMRGFRKKEVPRKDNERAACRCSWHDVWSHPGR